MIRRLLLLSLAVAAAIPGLQGTAAQPVAVNLLFEAPQSVQADPLARIVQRADTVQARATVVNLAALDSDVMDVAVAPGRTLRVRLDRRTLNPDGSASWSGRVDDAPLSDATFVRSGNIVQGSLRTLDTAWSLEPMDAGGSHVIREIDLQAMGAELPPRIPPQQFAAAADPPPTSGDDGTVFDVLVVYTERARIVAGSDANVKTRIALGITETNTAYANSGIIPRLRLVGAEPITYTESGNLEIDLNAVTNTSDGLMDAVHARRNALGADLVKLVVGEVAGGACGVAWLMPVLSSSYAATAFSVTAYPCISPNYTFGHELGHNMGSLHAPEDGGSGALYPYSFGYKHPGRVFRTVMAYDCPSGGCPRVLYFSNPSVLYSGLPTGTAAQHNNALSINNARNTIANWRQAVGPNTAPTISPIAAQTTLANQPLSVPFTVSDAETPAGNLTVQATSSNTTLVAASGIGHGGSGGSRILTLSPRPNEHGTTTITLSVSDGAATTQRTFTLTVTPVNNAPTFVGLPPFVSTSRDVPTSFGVTVSDLDSAGTSLLLSVTGSNPMLLQPGSIVVTPTATTSTTRTFQVSLSPAAGQTGTSTLTLAAGDGSATSTAAVPFSVTATTAAPDPPTALTATADGLNVTLSWTVALTGSAPSHFSVEIGTDAGTTTLPIQSVTWPATTLTLPLPAGTYYARVRAVNSIGSSAPSPEAQVVVSEPSPIPGPPGNFFAQTSGRTVTFTWTASVAGAAATSYLLEAGSGPGLANLARLDTGSPASSFVVSNVPPGTYWVRVRGSNAAGTGAPSQDVAIVMGTSSGCVGLPGTPVLLTPVVTGNNVSLNWTAPSAGAMPSGYVLMAGSRSGAADLAYFNTGSASTSFSASAPTGLYYVRVAGANACGVGLASNEVSFTLGGEVPGTPSDLSWTVSAGRVVSLAWMAPTSGPAPTVYFVEAGSASGLSDLARVSTGSVATSFAASAPPGTYYVRVRAINGFGAGVPSAEAVITVP